MTRCTSKDEFGRPLDISWPWGMDLRLSMALIIEEGVDYVLDDKEITFRVREKLAESGVFLIDQNTSGGNITVDGLVISVAIPFADLSDAGLVENGEYEYGLTLGDPIDGHRLQGRLFSLEEAGPEDSCLGNFSLSFFDFFATVQLYSGPQGPQGEQGEGYSGSYRLISSSGNITGSDSTVEIVCGGNAISVALPGVSELFLAGQSKQVRVFRPFGDTGDLEITGDGSDLVEGYLAAGESFFIESNGSNLLIG